MASVQVVDADPFAPPAYVEQFSFVDRLADILAWALVVDRLTDDEVAWVEVVTAEAQVQAMWCHARSEYERGYYEGRLGGVHLGLACR